MSQRWTSVSALAITEALARMGWDEAPKAPAVCQFLRKHSGFTPYTECAQFPRRQQLPVSMLKRRVENTPGMAWEPFLEILRTVLEDFDQ